MLRGPPFLVCPTRIHDSKLDAEKSARNPREVRPRGKYLLQSKLNEANLTPLGKICSWGSLSNASDVSEGFYLWLSTVVSPDPNFRRIEFSRGPEVLQGLWYEKVAPRASTQKNIRR